MKQLNLEINAQSTEEFTQDFGDVMTIKSFITCCQNGGFIDYDGYANEILLNGKIVNKEVISPSHALFFKEKLLELDQQYGGLEIVWYNN